jgi:hypothetical protein
VPHFWPVLPEVGIFDQSKRHFRMPQLNLKHLQSPTMKYLPVLILIVCCMIACNKSSAPSGSTSAAFSSKPPDAVQQKLQDFAGSSATNCGRLDVKATGDQSKAASDCAMQASQGKHPFFVAYDMPGMAVGVAGNTDGKLHTVESQGEGPSAAVTEEDCPSQLRVAGSGRVTCFAPGDMGSIGGGHTAIPPGLPNPHAVPKQK